MVVSHNVTSTYSVVPPAVGRTATYLCVVSYGTRNPPPVPIVVYPLFVIFNIEPLAVATKPKPPALTKAANPVAAVTELSLAN